MNIQDLCQLGRISYRQKPADNDIRNYILQSTTKRSTGSRLDVSLPWCVSDTIDI
jgi:hypothetical protein